MTKQKTFTRKEVLEALRYAKYKTGSATDEEGKTESAKWFDAGYAGCLEILEEQLGIEEGI